MSETAGIVRREETSQRIELKLGKSFNAFDVMRSEMNKTFALEHFTDVEFLETWVVPIGYVSMVYGESVYVWFYRLHFGHHIRKIESTYVYIHFK